MKKFTIVLILLISFNGISQTEETKTKTKYQVGMIKAFDLWKNDKPWEAANLFERIATAEPDKPANMIELRILTCAKPPLKWPTKVRANWTNRSVIPPRFINSPARINNGTANRAN